MSAFLLYFIYKSNYENIDKVKEVLRELQEIRM